MGKNLEGSGCGQIEALSWHLRIRAKKDHEKTLVRIAGVPAKIRTEHLTNKSLDVTAGRTCSVVFNVSKIFHTGVRLSNP
jgi:hypothetical protein